MKIYKKIKACRVCGNKNLRTIYNFGNLALTGHFPKLNESDQFAPMNLVHCESNSNNEFCGLVQLEHDYDTNLLYGDNYGYRSSLNKSMVKHLQDIVLEAIPMVGGLSFGDNVLDIASNDGTLLKNYEGRKLNLYAVDPTIKKFSSYYDDIKSNLKKIPTFFGSAQATNEIGNVKFKIITSIAMLYDLPSPSDFFCEIEKFLDEDGVWVCEQSYLLSMIDTNSFDTVCHEHLEYYSLNVLDYLAKKNNLDIRKVSFNDSNGGSFRVFLTKKNNKKIPKEDNVRKTLEFERKINFPELYDKFVQSIEKTKKDLNLYLKSQKQLGKKIYGFGASTKGNTLLQAAGINSSTIELIYDINDYKNQRVTPGSRIPISCSDDVYDSVDIFIVLPWHFKDHILMKEKDLIKKNIEFLFPLPNMELIELKK